MLEDLKVRAIEENAQQDAAAGGQGVSPHVQLRAKQMQVLDLERNILQVYQYCASYYLQWFSF